MCSVNVVFLSKSFYLSILSACSGRLPAAGALFAGGEAGGGAVAAGRAGGAVAGGVVARRRVVAGGRQESAWVHNHHHNNELTQLKTGARDVVVGEKVPTNRIVLPTGHRVQLGWPVAAL